MPGLFIDFTTAPTVGNQSPAASAPRPNPASFGQSLERATRPASTTALTGRRETSTPPAASPRTTRQTEQPSTETAQQQNFALTEQRIAETDQQASVPRAENEVLKTDDSLEVEFEDLSQTSPAETMAPFYMAALFDQSANFLEPSALTERVAAAERVQEFVASWLQTQSTESNPLATAANIPTDDQAEEVAVVTAALDILSQYVENTLGTDTKATATTVPVETQDTALSLAPLSEENTSPVSGAPLNDQNIRELRQLMAVMMQSGRIPEPFSNLPDNPEIQQQLDRILPLVISASSTAAQAAQTVAISQIIPPGEQVNILIPRTQGTASERSRAGEGFAIISPANILPEEMSATTQTTANLTPVLKQGLQESQMAKIFSPATTEAPSDQAFAASTAESFEELASAERSGTNDVKFAGTALHQTGSATHMVADGPRVVPAVGLNDGVAVKMMQLPTGQQLPETQLVDQVVSYLSASNNGTTSRMQLRLNPAELGTLRIELTMEGDKLRAHLHAQTQQVQEVLDRHLPQLRDALQMQGLKIDNFRVDVQGGQSQARDQAFDGQHPQQHGQPANQRVVEDWPPPEIDIPLQQILQQPQGSISLRV